MSSERVQFGQFVLDIGRYELTCTGKPVRIERIPMDLLILLVRENGRLIGREEIIEKLWGKGLHFDTDNSINTAIRKIRHALGDDSGNPQYVETVLGRGYRFKGRTVVASRVVGEIEADRSRIMLAVQPFSPDQPEIRRAILLGLALAVALLLSFLFWKPGWRAAPNPIVSLAVLPLENLSRDSDQDYFADGMTDALTTDLGKISALRVISRTSVMQYKGTKKPLQEIARELKVDAILEGTVARSGNRVRVTANLVQTFPERHLWAESYDSEIGDV